MGQIWKLCGVSLSDLEILCELCGLSLQILKIQYLHKLAIRVYASLQVGQIYASWTYVRRVWIYANFMSLWVGQISILCKFCGASLSFCK